MASTLRPASIPQYKVVKCGAIAVKYHKLRFGERSIVVVEQRTQKRRVNVGLILLLNYLYIVSRQDKGVVC